MNQKQKSSGAIKIAILFAILLSATSLIIGIMLPLINKADQSNQTISYNEISPYVEEYLKTENIVSTDGHVIVPNSSYNSDDKSIETTALTVEQAINNLLNDGKLEYLKGEKGDRGATGASGANGTNGQNGTDGQDSASSNISTGSGLSYSGGVISLKPCSVDQVLSYDGTVWDCATVTANGVADGNTTNLTATLARSGEMVHGTITDSNGNTITTNQINVADAVFSSSRMSDYATTANLSSLDSRIAQLESVTAGNATQDWVKNYVQAENYLTSSGLANYLDTNDYVTDSTLTGILAGYLLKNDFAATLNSHLLAGSGVEISEDSNGNSVISSLQNAAIFEMIHNYLIVTNPDPNKIYVDLDENPMKEYIYLNGAGGVTTDPSQPAAWAEVGSVTIDLTPYSTTNQMNTAISNALTNQLSDLENNSNLSTILTNYVKTGDMTTAITNATTDMATKTWVNAQGFLTTADNDSADSALKTWVNSQNFAKTSDLSAFYTKVETDNLLTSKANQSDLDTMSTRVSAIGAALGGKQDKLTAGQNITISGSVISANVDLSSYATKSYVDSQDFVTNSAALSTYATQTYVNSQGFITQDALSGYATENWVDTKGYLTSTNLTGYAKESWVDANYLTTADLSSYLTTNNYATKTDVADAITGADNVYVDHSEFATVLHNNLKAGSGIAIGADNTISATMFVMTTDRLTITNPDPNMIYVETGTDSSSPVSQYIYLNGKDGAPTDPSNTAAWQKIGDLSGVDLSGYSTTDQMNTAINDAIAAEVTEFNNTYATQNWVDSQGYLKASSLDGYATDQYVSENYLATSALNGYATQDWTNSQGFLKSSSLTGYATQSWVTSQGYLTNAALTGYATQTWVNGQGYLTSDAAAANYVTKTALNTTLSAYQPLITGGASSITSANLKGGMVLQSDDNGKVAASSVSIASLSAALTDVATIKSRQSTNEATIASLQSKVNSATSMGNWGEIDTGQTFRGKKVYRNDFTLYVNSSANQSSDLVLNDTANYVDDIVNVGGWWAIGYQTERHQLPDAGDGTNYAYVLIYGSDNKLYFRSKANNARSGQSNGTAIIIVEYTKK